MKIEFPNNTCLWIQNLLRYSSIQLLHCGTLHRPHTLHSPSPSLAVEVDVTFMDASNPVNPSVHPTVAWW